MIRKNIKKLSSILITSIMLVSTTLSTPVKAIANYENNKSIISSKRNVMYYGDWSIWEGQGNFYPKDIPADQLTNLNFAFLNFDSNGNLLFTDKYAAINSPVGQDGVTDSDTNAGIFIALQQLRAENPNLKLGVSVGGWSKSANFPLVTKDSSKRANLVTNLIKFIDYTNMDLIDIDWEYPTIKREPDKVDNINDEGNPNARSEDKNNFILLLKDLREALDAKGKELGKKYELSVALPASINNLTSGIDIKNIFNLVDFANIMTYDMHGSFDKISGHHTGLYTNPKDTSNLSIDSTVKYLISNGAPSEKIVIGAAYYTRGWEKVSKGTDSNNPGLFGEASQVTKNADSTPSRGAQNEAQLTNGNQGRMSGLWSYRSLDKLKDKYPGLKEYWDDSAKAPYLYNPETGSFFTYDNVRSIIEKTSYVKEKNLGGIIGWMAAQDKPTNSSKRDELTKATKEGLYGQAPLPQNNIVYHKLNISTTVQKNKEPWGNNEEYTISITNNEKLTEMNEVLKAVENSSKTIKLPKLYIKSDNELTSADASSGTVTYKDGFTIVDLQTVYESKTIEPGKSYIFKLKNTSEIKSIDLVQRMSTSSPDMSRQTIYENGSGGDTPKENTPPELKGVSDLSLKIGDSFSPLDGVTATDKNDGDLTSKIKVEGTVDTTKASSYKLTYTVINSKGLKTEKVRTITVVDNQTDSPDFGVGKGIKWPEQVFSPFVDMCAWIDKPDYSNNGTVNLKKIYEDTGIKFFNLGFIGVIQENPVYSKKVNWKWGSIGNLNEELLSDEVLKNKTPEQQKRLIDQRPQYLGIKKSIKDIRDLGGDVTISIGGAGITPFWLVTQDKDTLVKTYKEIIQGYGLTRLDLDIEGSAQDKAMNIANAKAIKKVQEDTHVDIVLTLPVSPSGLTQDGLDVLEAYLHEGVSIKLVNIMTMCYGSNTLDKGENYGTASLRAVDSTKDQLKNYFQEHGKITLSDKEAYRKIGTTPSIGFETESHPIFTTEWTELIVNQAIEKSLGMISFWSMNRDANVEDNKGVRTSYEFTELCKKFPMHNDTKPVIKGASDKTINVGDKFDPRKGITAYDSEDGDLTSKIQVSGTVNTSKAGQYKVSYKVVDSRGLEAIVTIIITVAKDTKPVIKGASDKTINIGDKFDPRKGITAYDSEDGDLTSKIQVSGTVNTSKAGQYKVSYKVVDSRGLEATVTITITVENNSSSSKDNYDPEKAYVAGDIVIFNGVEYKAKWWVQGEDPDSSQAWTKNNKDDKGDIRKYKPGMIFVAGQKALYNGKTYEAKWWTNTVPGSDDSWKLIS